MRPPLLWIAVGFGAGLWVGLESLVGMWSVGLVVLTGATLVARRAPVAGAFGLAGVAGLLWGCAAVARRDADCAGRWARESPGRHPRTHAAVIRLADPWVRPAASSKARCSAGGAAAASPCAGHP